MQQKQRSQKAPGDILMLELYGYHFKGQRLDGNSSLGASTTQGIGSLFDLQSCRCISRLYEFRGQYVENQTDSEGVLGNSNSLPLYPVISRS
jgi:hypothetical protein